MCTSDFCPDDELSDDTTATHSPAVTKAVTRPDIGRRTFLKAAALGTAAAALARTGSGGFGFGPLSALADDLSTFQCTANDVQITGVAQVINEECGCSGDFTAEVAFPVRNNAASARNCITLHLVQGTLSNGQTFGPVDVLLQGTIEGKSDGVLTGFIEHFPCGAGLVCFGSPSADGRRRCDPGECSTVSWRVPGQDPDCDVAVKQISSKCRHQRICIQGRGSTTLQCANSDGTLANSCEVPCGGTTTLRLATTGGVAPFFYELRNAADEVVASTTTDSLFVDFTGVGPITEDTTFTGTVTDENGEGCADSDDVTLTTAEVAVDIEVSGTDNCNGILTITPSVDGSDSCSFSYELDGDAVTEDVETDTLVLRLNDDGTLTYRNLDNTCHTIEVSATCGNCVGTGTVAIAQSCVVSSVGDACA